MSVPPPLLPPAAPPPGVCNLDPSVPGKSPRYPPDATLSLPSDSPTSTITANLTVTFARIAAISGPLMNAVANKRTEIRKPVPAPGEVSRRSLGIACSATRIRQRLQRSCYDILPRWLCAENLAHFDPSSVPYDASAIIALRADKKNFRHFISRNTPHYLYCRNISSSLSVKYPILITHLDCNKLQFNPFDVLRKTPWGLIINRTFNC